MTDYGAWFMPKLLTECRKRGIKCAGRKREVVERLQAYDRNADFGGSEILEREYEMTVAKFENYKDVNKDTVLPALKQEAISAYLAKMDKKIDQNAKNLYDSAFLKYARVACENNLVFIRSECKAQLKKKLSYKVDVCMDSDGCLVECQCECAVGMGPSAMCKHVCAVLLALQGFGESGEIITEETCTQKLQTFHKRKPYRGSPIKAQDLLLANDGLKVNYDPRPREFQDMPGYNDHFRNVWLNHPTIANLPVAQLYPLANTLAVDRDHDYFTKPLSSIWLDKVNVTEVSVSKIHEIEMNTRGQARNSLWLQERRKRLTSSNFARICKATQKTDLDKLANNFTKYSPQLSVAPIVYGRCYESVAIKKLEEMCQVKTVKCGSFVSLSHPFLAASPDALLGDDITVEVKCPYSAKNEFISPETVKYLVNEEDDLKLDQSHDYYYQIQGQLFCTERQECWLIIYTLKDVKICKVKREEQFIDRMVKKLEFFFNNHFRSAVLNKFYFNLN